MIQQRQPFDERHIGYVPDKAGLYVIYDLAGPIYVGRSGVSIQRRLKSHHSGVGNQNIALAMRIGAASSLTFKYWEFAKAQTHQMEGMLIQELGVADYANLRRERIPSDPDGWECVLKVAKDARTLPIGGSMGMFTITKAVGKHSPNLPQDVKAVAQKLMSIGKIPQGVCNGVFDQTILKGIIDTQRHWMQIPDGVISVGGRTQKFLDTWKIKSISPGVQLPGKLKEAWDLVNPLLPEGSYCSSGFRSAETQRKILHKFFLSEYRPQIIAKYTQRTYDAVSADLIANEQKVLDMVRGVGQAIAAPGKSAHQQSKAIDIGGPATIDQKQVEIVALVARAHPNLFSGKILKERNGCVHFEIR
ncbi:MAG: hypothetical protein AB1545_12950 [Thermodesulfobacteriota bacterium]